MASTGRRRGPHVTQSGYHIIKYLAYHQTIKLQHNSAQYEQKQTVHGFQRDSLPTVQVQVSLPFTICKIKGL